MKFKYTIFLSSLIIFASVTQAQNQNQISNLASPKEIAPPAYALNRIPKGGKSRFYGAAFFGAPLNEEVRVHFYQWPQLNSPPDEGDDQRHDSHQNYRVDIFVRKQKKGAQFHLAQSVDVESSIFRGDWYAFDKVLLRANYLAPKNPIMPMIDLECTVTDGFHGAFGTDITMVFDQSWKAKPSIKDFAFGGNTTESAYSTFGLDARGIVQVMRNLSISGAEALTTEYWTWGGEEFVHTETDIRGADVKNPGRFKVKPADD